MNLPRQPDVQKYWQKLIQQIHEPPTRQEFDTNQHDFGGKGFKGKGKKGTPKRQETYGK